MVEESEDAETDAEGSDGELGERGEGGGRGDELATRIKVEDIARKREKTEGASYVWKEWQTRAWAPYGCAARVTGGHKGSGRRDEGKQSVVDVVGGERCGRRQS